MATEKEAELRKLIEALHREASQVDAELRESSHPEAVGLDEIIRLIYGIPPHSRSKSERV